MVHIMVDIETLDVSPSAVILSIGAVAFDNEIRDTFYTSISPDQKDRTISLDTVKWWMKQASTERRVAFGGRLSLSSALNKFVAWLETHQPQCLWANSPAFDLVILKHACSQVGITWPIPYHIERDFRTVRELWFLDKIDVGNEHNALSDAKCQALSLIAGMKKCGL